MLIRLSLFTSIILLFIPLPARGDDLTDQLEKMLLRQEDLPAKWKLSTELDGHEYHKPLVGEFERAKKAMGNNFVYRSQGVTVSNYLFLFYTFSFKTEGYRDSLERSFDRARKRENGWNWEFFHFGNVLFVILPADAEVDNRLEDILSWKYVEPKLKAIIEQLDKAGVSSQGRAEEALVDLLEEVPECYRLRIQAGLFYLNRLSPPKPDLAIEEFDAALDLSQYISVPKKQLDLIYINLAKICFSRGKKKEAYDYLKKIIGPEDGGLRGQAKYLGELARLQVTCRDIEGCLLSLERAVPLEASLGFNNIINSAKNDSAFAVIHKHERFVALVEKYGSLDKPMVFCDPECPKLTFRKIRILLLPPLVCEGKKRKSDLESSVESAFKRKLNKESVVFGRKRDVLDDKEMGDCSRFLCDHAIQAILAEKIVDLKKYAGGKCKIDGYLEKLRGAVRAYGIARSVPSFLVASCFELFPGAKGDDTSVMASVMFYNCSTHRVLVFLRLRKSFSAKAMKKGIPALVSELHRTLQKRLRKGN